MRDEARVFASTTRPSQMPSTYPRKAKGLPGSRQIIISALQSVIVLPGRARAMVPASPAHPARQLAVLFRALAQTAGSTAASPKAKISAAVVQPAAPSPARHTENPCGSLLRQTATKASAADLYGLSPATAAAEDAGTQIGGVRPNIDVLR